MEVEAGLERERDEERRSIYDRTLPHRGRAARNIHSGDMYREANGMPIVSRSAHHPGAKQLRSVIPLGNDRRAYKLSRSNHRGDFHEARQAFTQRTSVRGGGEGGSVFHCMAWHGMAHTYELMRSGGVGRIGMGYPFSAV